jgi:hypothetical protein
MKNILLLVLFLVSSTFIFSQDTRPRKVDLEYKEKPSFYIDLNGKKVSGLISFNDYTPKFFMFRANENTEVKKIAASEVKSFTHKRSNVRITFKNKFYRRINSENGIQFYKYYHAKQYANGDFYSEKGSMAGYYKHYVLMPDKLKLTYFWDKKMKMKFKKTVSKLVKDCPDLSMKIKKKVEGYVYVYSKGLNLTLWNKIAKEYEECYVSK